MRSYLARNACRACPSLAPRRIPLVPPSALLCLNHQHTPHPQAAPGLARPPSRRTFFGPFKKPQRQILDPQIIPGYEVLLQFRAHENDDIRPPPSDDLVKALSVFFRAIVHRPHLNSLQAYCAARVIQHLRDFPPARPEPDTWRGLTRKDLETIQRVALRRPRSDDVNCHLMLAKQAFKGLGSLEGEGGDRPFGELERHYMTALGQYATLDWFTNDVTELLQGRPRPLDGNTYSICMSALRGFSKWNDKETVLKLIKVYEGLGVPTDTVAFSNVMAGFYARLDEVPTVYEWCEKVRESGKPPAPTVLEELIKFARRNPEEAPKVNDIFKKLLHGDKPVPQQLWYLFLRWHIILREGNVEQLDAFIDRLAIVDNLRQDEQQDGFPYVDTVNYLIEAASEDGNPILAERIWDWSQKKGIRSSVRTYALQLAYRLDAKDLPGAQISFEKIRKYGGLDRQDEKSLSALNKYLRALCQYGRTHLERLLTVLSLLEEHQLELEPKTVAKLTRYFLENDMEYDLIDTLSIHLLQFSMEERRLVLDEMAKFALLRKTSSARAWNAYSLLRQFLSEAPREMRVRLMESFFTMRKRPDMAVIVFGHMRAHENPDVRPDLAAYISVLEHLGREPDMESLKIVHNMFKMDTTIHPDTRLYNALMLAYTGCGDPMESLEFWREITNSVEGPTYETLELYFWTCEKHPIGSPKARDVWDKLLRMDIQLTPRVFAAYCGAIASCGALDEVKTMIMEMDGSAGFYPEPVILRASYEGLPNQRKQNNFEEWAKARFPKVWAEVDKLRRKPSSEKLHTTFKPARVYELKA